VSLAAGTGVAGSSDSLSRVNPGFVTAGDPHIAPDSVLVNRGNANYYVPRPMLYDLDGNPRWVGTAVDLGAYETDVLFRHGYE